MNKKLAIALAVTFLVSGSTVLSPSTVRALDISTIIYDDLSGHWAEGAVQKLLNKNAIPFADYNFNTDKIVTRSEFALMLYRSLDLQINYLMAPDIKDYFTDVNQDAVYATALIDLVTANILEGKGTFNPNGSISREEMLHYIMNAFKYKMGDKFKMIKIGKSHFLDNDMIKPEYNADLAIAAYYKLVVGNGNNFFNPKNNATRAEAAVIINNLLNLLEKENSSVNSKNEVKVEPSFNLDESSIEMKLTISNKTKENLVFYHSPGYQVDFVLLDADKNELYRWSEGKSFILMLSNSTITAGETREFTFKLDGEEYNKIKDKIVYLKAYIVGTSDTFEKNPDGYEIKIQ